MLFWISLDHDNHSPLSLLNGSSPLGQMQKLFLKIAYRRRHLMTLCLFTTMYCLMRQVCHLPCDGCLRASLKVSFWGNAVSASGLPAASQSSKSPRSHVLSMRLYGEEMVSLPAIIGAVVERLCFDIFLQIGACLYRRSKFVPVGERRCPCRSFDRERYVAVLGRRGEFHQL